LLKKLNEDDVAQPVSAVNLQLYVTFHKHISSCMHLGLCWVLLRILSGN